MNNCKKFSFYWFWKKHGLIFKRCIIGLIIVALAVPISIGSAAVIKADKLRQNKADNKIYSPIKINTNRDYGEKGFKTVAENSSLALLSDTTNGEIAVMNKSTGNVWYSNPTDKDSDTYSLESKLKSQINLTVIDVTTGKTSLVDNTAASIRMGCMDYQKDENGITFTFSFSKYGIVVPINYTITEDSLLVTIKASEIKELIPDVYMLISIDVLPYFGAGSITDSGYIFIPDGCGSIINFNNGKEKYAAYNQQVYGRNYMNVETKRNEINQQVYIPVFGIKKNNEAILAIISNGSSEANIQATVSRKTSAYNQAYSTVTYRNAAFKNLTGEAILFDGADPTFRDKDYSIKYYFLKEESANYSGMAKCYRKYLQDNYLLNNSNSSIGPLSMDIYGAVSIKKYVMGQNVDCIIPLTTYKQIFSLMDDLGRQNINSTNFSYMGALKGGLDGKIVCALNYEDKLGTRKEFESLNEVAESNGIKLFYNIDPINIYKKGNGYDLYKDTVKTNFDAFSYQYLYNLNTLSADMSSRHYLLTPKKAGNVINNISGSNNNNRNISLSSIGNMIYSDYSENTFKSRNSTEQIWNNSLNTLSQNVDNLMLDGANAYSFKYADSIENIPLTDSGFDVTDYSVPFLQMVLRGCINLYSNSININTNYDESFLQAIETGTSLKYSVFFSNSVDIISTKYNYLSSCSYDSWKSIIYSQTNDYQKYLKIVKNQEITNHERLNQKCSVTTFENGVKVYVNYASSDYTFAGVKIPAKGYLIVE